MQFTAVNWHLTAEEAGYVVTDSRARMVVVSYQLAGLAAQLGPVLAPGVRRLMIGGTIPGWDSFDDAVGALPTTPIPDECEGDIMLYSSGTTGRPKGIRRPVSGAAFGEHPDIPGHWLRELLGMTEGDVYLSPAPLYHAAPLAWSMSCHRTGATVVVMERFEAEQALRLIEAHRVTHSQWVPTMFVRLLKLPASVRCAYDLGSLRWAVHAAAPCPVPVKQAMIDWWGPILFEFYSMTEGFGAASIFSDEWLRKPGSVGRPLMGVPHVVGLDGAELPPGEVGHDLVRGRHAVGVPRRPGQDRRRGQRARLADRRRRRVPRHRRLPLPHRPGQQPDHFGRGEHLSPGNRERAHHASGRARRRGARRA